MQREALVVGTDGSRSATVAVRHATELARALDATIHLVTAYKPHSGALHDPRVPARAILAQSAAAVEAEQVPLRTYAIPGNPVDALIEIAEDSSARMIIVGSKGMTGTRRFLLGSVPDQVSHHASCTVLIVRST